MTYRDEIVKKAKREGVKVEDYALLTSNGRPIRKATKVIFPDGTEIPFTERMGEKEAIWRAELIIGSRIRNYFDEEDRI